MSSSTPAFTWHLLPDELRDRPQWVTWRREKREGKPTKVPYNPHTGKRAKSNDSSTWGTHSECMAALERDKKYDGIGFMASKADPYTVIDLDACVDDQGNVTPEAQEFVALINSYTEESPSRRGRRMIARGALPPTGRKKGDVEMYCTTRFVTLTGWHIEGTPATIEDRQEQILAMHRRVWGDVTAKNGSHPPRETEPATQDDQTLIDKVRKESKYDDLWCGRWQSHYTSQSEADLALAGRIGYFFGPRNSKVDEIFRRSDLMRPKWDRQDYREETIAKALAGKTEFYSDWLKAHQNGSNGQHGEEPPHPADAIQVREPVQPGDRVTLADVIETCRRWLHLPDDGYVKVNLGAYQANRMGGDPNWLMTIGAPGSGKTEILNAMRGLPDVYVNSSLSGESALLSGTSNRDKAKSASGGLLKEIGEFGVLVLKDFTSILDMKHEQRGPLLAALREIYDGSWTRRVGVDGGKTLSWSGKMGLLAGCTPIIDRHHGVIGAMGERFCFYRLPETEAEAQAKRALQHFGREKQMREELAAAVNGLFAGITPQQPPPFPEAEVDQMVALASLAARCRSAVERDSRTHQVLQRLEPEAPGRLAGVLLGLLHGLRAIGVEHEEPWELVARVAVHSMPALRWQCLLHAAVHSSGGPIVTPEFEEATRQPYATVRRALEDLWMHGILLRSKVEHKNAVTWELSPWTREKYAYVARLFRKLPKDGVEASSSSSSSSCSPNTVSEEFSEKSGWMAPATAVEMDL